MYSPLDWRPANMDTLPECPYRGEKIIIDQKLIAPNCCFFASACGSVCDVYGEKEGLDVMQDYFGKFVVSKGLYDPKIGGNLIDGVNAARKMWNERHPDRPVCSFRIPVGGPEFSKAMSKGYSLMIGIFVNSDYYRDVMDDGIVQMDAREDGMRGHAVRIFSPYRVLDNFPGTIKSLNSYVFDDFTTKIEKKLIQPFAYFFAPLPYNAQTINDLPADQRKEAFERGLNNIRKIWGTV